MSVSAVDHVVVVAVDPEFQAVYDRLSDREWVVDERDRQYREVSGTWSGKRVQLLQCGLGPVTFARNFSGSRLLSDRVSLLGICGALREGLGCGDIIEGTEVIDEGPGTRVVSQLSSSVPAQNSAGAKKNGAVIAGTYLCMDRIAETGDEKASFGLKWKCDAVDMESYPFVQRCFQLGLPAQVLKVVSDDVSQSLPPVNQARLSSGEYDLAVMAKVWKMWTAEQSRAARENLFLSLGNLLSSFELSYLGQDFGRRWLC